MGNHHLRPGLAPAGGSLLGTFVAGEGAPHLAPQGEGFGQGNGTPLEQELRGGKPLAPGGLQPQVACGTAQPQGCGRLELGRQGNLLDERPEYARLLQLESPVINEVELEHIHSSGFATATLSTLYSIADGPAGLEQAVAAGN